MQMDMQLPEFHYILNSISVKRSSLVLIHLHVFKLVITFISTVKVNEMVSIFEHLPINCLAIAHHILLFLMQIVVQSFPFLSTNCSQGYKLSQDFPYWAQ